MLERNKKHLKENRLNKLIVKKAAVLGAGVMGAQIAAHLANANVPVVLFDLPAKAGDKNGIVHRALSCRWPLSADGQYRT